MSNRTHSLLIGAVIAAVVSLPALAGDPNWVTGSRASYDVRSLKVDDVVATLRVDVTDRGPATLQISGLKQRMGDVKANASNGVLHIEGHNMDAVWDWSHWFDFSHFNQYKPDQLIIAVTVPRGTRVEVNDIVGKANIGSTEGELRFSSAGETDSTIGNVAAANVSLAGSGKVLVGNVAGDLKAETAGSGDIRVGNTGPVNADIAGSGSIQVGHINGSLKVDIAGSGDFSAASVNGPLGADIAGSGSVTIGGGEANPLHVDIMGSGDVTFGGMAVNPHVSCMGSGSVKLRASRGSLSNECTSNLKIGP
jgi:hypothetical protein